MKCCKEFSIGLKLARGTVALAICGLAVAGIVACSDNVTEVNKNTSIKVLESGKKLSKQPCDTANVGEVMYVKDSSATFVCDGENWNTFDGEAGKSGEDCSAKQNSDGDFELTCGDKEVEVVKNGRIEKDGADCTMIDDKDDVVLLVCGEGKDADTTTFYKATKSGEK